MITWLRSLFSKGRNTHTFLTKEEVHLIESALDADAYDKEFLAKKYGISKTTLYRISNGTHRFSTKMD